MKFLVFTLMFLLTMQVSPAFCEDMRQLQVQARQTKQQLLEKAKDEKQAALEAAEKSRREIFKDRTRLETAIKELKNQNNQLTTHIKTLETESVTLQNRETELTQKLAETDSVMRELVGVIRINAKDILAIVEQNHQSALENGSSEFLEAISNQARFPGMADIEKMVSVLHDEISKSGQVYLTQGPIIDRSGNSVQTEILVLGNFTAAYRNDQETGFLTYSPAGKKLFALSQLPSGRFQKQLQTYMDGDSRSVPIDISRGAALRQLTHRLSLWEQIPKGGPIVWPILAILALGIVIVVERVIFLLRKKMDADKFTNHIETLSKDRNWKQCETVCSRYANKPVARVVAAGLACWHMKREAMENALQEAILREIPPMERFLSTLGMLAAIAPLLGLLGTVTGMIDTFHVITQHGTGEPRMMSGGISEALVTTMLGLSVAIPIMLAHTLLNRTVDTRIGQMEEKAISLVNMVHKNRNADNL